MIQLLVAVSAFLLAHLLPVIPGLRSGLIARLGKPAYLTVHSLISLATLAWVIAAALQAPTVPLWDPAGWQAWVTLIVSPIALFLVFAGLISPNPLSLTLFPRAERGKGAIVLVTRHPIFWGALLWALSHIPPNGALSPVLLFSILALLAASGFWLGDRRARRRHKERWAALAADTSILPFSATLAGRNRLRIDLPLAIAALLAAATAAWLLTGGHAALFGADPVAATSF